MRTLVVLDAAVICYLLELVERYGFKDLDENTRAREHLTTALRLLSEATKKAKEEEE